MKITVALIDKLIALRNGEALPASSLKGEWVEELLREGVLVSTSHGSRRNIIAANPATLEHALVHIDERFRDIDLLRETLTEKLSRSEQAADTGNSKMVMARSCPGFPVNSYEPILCKLNGKEFIVEPADGSFLFVADWQNFEIPEDVIVVGIENMENFRKIRQQREFFEKEIISPSHGWAAPCETRGMEGSIKTIDSEGGSLLFVSRYPQSTDLRRWLQSIPNQYVHFGDFDLAGINIFLTEFHKYIGSKSCFLIPSDIESRLISGSHKRYDDQYPKFKNIHTDDAPLQSLVDMINKYHRCYDQEGYIGG